MPPAMSVPFQHDGLAFVSKIRCEANDGLIDTEK